MKKRGLSGRITETWWMEDEHAAREMTLTIEHEDGTQSLVVVDINRMTDRLNPVKVRKPRKGKPS